MGCVAYGKKWALSERRTPGPSSAQSQRSLAYPRGRHRSLSGRRPGFSTKGARSHPILAQKGPAPTILMTECGLFCFGFLLALRN